MRILYRIVYFKFSLRLLNVAITIIFKHFYAYYELFMNVQLLLVCCTAFGVLLVLISVIFPVVTYRVRHLVSENILGS